MVNEKMENALNSQINKELYSAYLYLAMQAYFQELDLQGFVNWMNIQVQEEVAHAMGLYNYVIERGAKVVLNSIDKPETNWKTPLEIFENVLKHEQFVTSSINTLMDIAEEIRDHAAKSFLQWYVKEQVEEEASAGAVLAKLKLIGNDANALLQLDKDLAARTFTAPVIG